MVHYLLTVTPCPLSNIDQMYGEKMIPLILLLKVIIANKSRINQEIVIEQQYHLCLHTIVYYILIWSDMTRLAIFQALLYVHSAPTHRTQRDVIRCTYGDPRLYPVLQIKVIMSLLHLSRKTNIRLGFKISNPALCVL